MDSRRRNHSNHKVTSTPDTGSGALRPGIEARRRHNSPGGLISLTEAANLAPGRPSTNCVWRWARKGVLARSGERLRLKHIRVGSRLFTKATWLFDFFRLLAEFDARYFDDPEGAKPKRNEEERSRCASHDLRPVPDNETEEEIERELLEEGFAR